MLEGGEGGDRFIFTAAAESGPASFDRIADFSRRDGDRIDLKAIGDRDRFTFVGENEFSGRPGELRVSYEDGHALVSGDVDGDGTADLSIRVDGLTLWQALRESDFIL